MPVVSAFIYYVGTTAYDLRKVSSVIYPTDSATSVDVRFIDEPSVVVRFGKIAFEAAWQLALNSGVLPGGPAGGDLSGTYPNPSVVGIRGRSIVNSFPSGGVLTYDSISNTLKFLVTPVYTTLANAVLGQANQVVGMQVIIYSSPSTAETGTYSVNAISGVVGNYTKISDATNVASEVALDAAVPPLIATNVYTAIQELAGIVAASSVVTSGAVPATSTTVISSVPIASIAGVSWQVLLQRATDRMMTRIECVHDGASTFPTFYGMVGTSLPFDMTLTTAIVGVNLELSVTNPATAGTYRLRASTLPV